MSEPIRVIHFADAHIGIENYGRTDPATGTSTRLKDFLDRLDELINYALEHEADLAVFSGDAFKNRDPKPTQQREFASRIKRLSEAMPTLLVVGNHDMPGMVSKASSVDIFRALDVPGVIVGYKPEGRIVETRRGPLYLAWMPYPIRNRLLTDQENVGKSIDELQAVLREVVADILRQQAKEAAQHAMPRLLAGHFTVAEAHFGSERSVMLGRDVAVLSSTLADPAWDYVALGHIHKHQTLNPEGYPPLVYSGSLERINFGEEKEQKGFCWVELTRGSTQWSFIPVAARPFETLQIDVRKEKDPTAAVLAKIKDSPSQDAVYRIQVQLRSEQEPALHDREIEAALPKASSVTIAREVEIDPRVRLGDLAPEALTPLQLIEEYFQSKDMPSQRVEALKDKAEELIRDSD